MAKTRFILDSFLTKLNVLLQPLLYFNVLVQVLVQQANKTEEYGGLRYCPHALVLQDRYFVCLDVHSYEIAIPVISLQSPRFDHPQG